MDGPRLVLGLPGGAEVAVGAEAIVGRAKVADVHLADARVSTVHAELSWRDAGYVVLARGGRVEVDGTPTAEARLAVGCRISLAPGIDLEVRDLVEADLPGIPRTAGRDALVYRPDVDTVAVHLGGEVVAREVVDGLPGRLLVALLADPEPRPWSALAAGLWPEEGALREAAISSWTAIDERRYRNRFDQVLATARQAVERVRPGRVVVLRQGRVAVALGPQDRVVHGAR